MTSDPIADMLTRVRNALMAKKTSVSMPHSKIKVAIAQILVDEGFILNFEVLPSESGVPQPVIQLKLKYIGRHRDRPEYEPFANRAVLHRLRLAQFALLELLGAVAKTLHSL